MWRDFLGYYRPHRRLLLAVFGAAALSGLLELGFPMAVRAFVDRLLPQADMPPILLAIAFLLVLYVGNAALLSVVTYWGHVLGVSIETELRRRAFDHLHALSMRFFDGEKTGHLVSRITTDLADRPLRVADGSELAGAVPPGRAVQRAGGGERRRRAGGAGVRQRSA